MRRAGLLLLALALVAGCGRGGGGSKAVAHVGGDAITQKQLEALVGHFRTEFQREGKGFPDERSAAFKQLRNHLLGLLVYRTELKQASDRLGVTVGEDEISKRLAAGSGGGEEEGGGGDTFPRDSVVAQLRTEKIFAKVTRDVTAPNQAELSARRNKAMAEFVARLKRETKVRYEPGYAPGP